MSDDTKSEEKSENGDLFATHVEKTNRILEELIAQSKAQPVVAPPQKQQTQKPQRYTRAQLKAAVAEGKITEEIMDEVLEAQLRADLQAELDQKLSAQVNQTAAAGRVQSEMDKFTSRIPALRQEGSPEWLKAAKAYKVLVEDGAEIDTEVKKMRVELAALRIAFPEGEEKAAPRETTSQRQRSVESAGSGAGRSSESKSKSGKWPSWLEDFRVDYYEQAIQKGRYSGRDDPKLKRELEILEKRNKERAA